jgi:hypothetical protein
MGGVDHIQICVSAEPDVAAVDPPYAVLPHQRNDVAVGHIAFALPGGGRRSRGSTS